MFLNDVKFSRNNEQVRLYLLYHYGTDINLSELQIIDKKHIKISA